MTKTKPTTRFTRCLICAYFVPDNRMGIQPWEAPGHCYAPVPCWVSKMLPEGENRLQDRVDGHDDGHDCQTFKPKVNP